MTLRIAGIFACVALASALFLVSFPSSQTGHVVSYDAETAMGLAHVSRVLSGMTTVSVVDADIVLAHPRDTLMIHFPKIVQVQDERDIAVTVDAGGHRLASGIDLEGDERTEHDTEYFVDPMWVPATARVHVELRSAHDLSGIRTIALTGLSTGSYSAIQMPTIDTTSIAHAMASTLPWVVSRADWGADETYRYADSPIWADYEAKVKAGKISTVPSQHTQDVDRYLSAKHPDDFNPIIRYSTENGHPLIWPIEKTKTVKKIIVHHTAENNVNENDDVTLMRGIYYYHAVVRGWGDIGYEYVVGRDGTVYQGRAGGDYVVGAHALWNNTSSVGVSAMGNFDDNTISKAQLKGLKSIITTLSTHYGIDLNETSSAFRECDDNDPSGCIIEDYTVSDLSGHRDVGRTDCPGEHLYGDLADIRSVAFDSRGRHPVVNPEPSNIIKNTGAIPEDPSLPKGPNVRIKLSYPGDMIRLTSGTSEPLTLLFGKWQTSMPAGKNATIVVGQKGLEMVLGTRRVVLPAGPITFLGSVVAIPSWDRHPDWDTSGTVNDNLFRGKITLYDWSGSLAVVNTLPAESYLRGLAEIANDEAVEKKKAIIVSARSYVLWYTDPANRKFPGVPWDGSDDPAIFQKYLGYGYEMRSPDTSRQADATVGEILTYQGKAIKPWYFSSSDGRTRSYKEYCEARVQEGSMPASTKCVDVPYLHSVTDPGGVGSELSGHGVGMSGNGAQYLADILGFDYRHILGYYYDGVKVEKKY